MELETLTEFFKWCTIVNVAILALWSFFLMFAQDLVYRMQCRWFEMPRETFTVVVYGFLGGAKLLLVTFCIVPYLALLLVA